MKGSTCVSAPLVDDSLASATLIVEIHAASNSSASLPSTRRLRRLAGWISSQPDERGEEDSLFAAAGNQTVSLLDTSLAGLFSVGVQVDNFTLSPSCLAEAASTVTLVLLGPGPQLLASASSCAFTLANGTQITVAATAYPGGLSCATVAGPTSVLVSGSVGGRAYNLLPGVALTVNPCQILPSFAPTLPTPTQSPTQPGAALSGGAVAGIVIGVRLNA